MVSPTSHWNQEEFKEVVEKCPLDMDGLFTHVDMNILQLGSYDRLIGMVGYNCIGLSLSATTRHLNA